MITLNSIISWTRFFSYFCSVVFFLLLTFPGMKSLDFHLQAGYLAYAIVGSCVVLLLHCGVVYLLVKYFSKKHSDKLQSFLIIKERFNLLLSLLVVVFFEGVCGDYFSYREWAFGVSKAESVFENIDSEWNLKQIEKSKEVSVKMDKNIANYTDRVYLKWELLKSK